MWMDAFAMIAAIFLHALPLTINTTPRDTPAAAWNDLAWTAPRTATFAPDMSMRAIWVGCRLTASAASESFCAILLLLAWIRQQGTYVPPL